MATVDSDTSCRPDLVIQTYPRSTKPPVVLTERDIDRIVEKKVGSTDFRVCDWCLCPFEEKNGFLGQYFSLSIRVKIKDKSRLLKFFAKTPPPVDSPQFEFLDRFDTFDKEITAYTEIFGKNGIHTGYKWMPEFYLGKKKQIMVLEDAKVEGYMVCDKYAPLDENHCYYLIKSLAMFHSRSLILEEKLQRINNTTLNLYGPLLDEVLFNEKDDRSRRALLSSTVGACTLVDTVEVLDPEEKTKIKNRLRTWARVLPKLLNPSDRFRNAMCHRDMWANNLMFKHDMQGNPTGCYIIDYQFLRYCPPAYDVVFSLYLTTDRKTREQHYESFLKTYHKLLSKELAVEGLDIEDCLPFVEFLKSCDFARQVAVVYAMMNMQIMLLSADLVEEYFGGKTDKLEEILYGDKRAELVMQQCRVEPKYKARIQEIILEIMERLPEHPPLDLH